MEQNLNQGGAVENQIGDGAKKNTGMIVGMVACAILALGGVGFGIYEMTQANQTKDQIADLKVEVKKDDGTTTTIETPEIKTTTEDGTTITIADSPTAVTYSDKYLYIPEMGIKVALGEELKNVTASTRNSDGRTTIWGTKGDDEHLWVAANMDFADPMTNPVGIGHLAIFEKGSSDIIAQWQKVYEFDNKEVYYWCSTVAEDMPGNKTDISEAFEVINNVFSNSSNYSRI